ncbi:nuclear transport factor 2 family protein [Streptomyces sp. NPDC047071]|uniref:nuclear transport factor 2 family protein n=1 Tax=Streptomyces sp. NPDC047071 TaxID=3154808 RepID=UPI0034530417
MSPLRTPPAEHTATAAIGRLVTDWYRALDRHDPLPVLTALVTDDVVLHLPEGAVHGHTGLAQWYEAVTHRFFDEEHTLTSLEVRLAAGPCAEVDLVVNWQTKVWQAPAARSTWLGFDAHQRWTVAHDGARWRIRTYTVTALAPMPGSPPL